jgi:hypothetical protein
VTAGYSKRSLPDKLGIRPGTAIIALGAPSHYAQLLGTLPEGSTISTRLSAAARFVHLFVTKRGELERAFPSIDAALVHDGMAWVSWPKKSSGVNTDVTEDVVRAVGLPLGLVDVKVCAVDEVWSGLKFVRRKEQRG